MSAEAVVLVVVAVVYLLVAILGRNAPRGHATGLGDR